MLAALLLTLVPGPDMALVLKNGARGNIRAWVERITGVVLIGLGVRIFVTDH